MAYQQTCEINKSDKNKETPLSREEWKNKLLEEFQKDSQFVKRKQEEKKFYLQRIEEMVMNLSKELLDVSSRVTDQRNSLNHFGFQKHPAGYDKLQKNLVKLYQELLEIMQQEGVKW